MAALPLLAASLVVLFGAQPASAQDAYQYWSYWWGEDGSWQYASAGPADRVVADGDVEGWRFVVSAEALPSDQPREAPDFGVLCSSEAPPDGQVRVGVVIDFGEPQDAPSGSEIPSGQNPQTHCVTVPENSTGSQVLAAVADIRSEQGITCGINGYPASGCFEIVAASSDESGEQETAPTFPIWAGVAGLLALSAVIVGLVLRRKNQPPA